MTGTKKTITVIAAITTLLSATAAFIAIRRARAADRENDYLKHDYWLELETDPDPEGLVDAGIMIQAQDVDIQSAITTAQEAGTVKGELEVEDEIEFGTVQDSSRTATLTKFKASLFKVRTAKEIVTANGDLKPEDNVELGTTIDASKTGPLQEDAIDGSQTKSAE